MVPGAVGDAREAAEANAQGAATGGGGNRFNIKDESDEGQVDDTGEKVATGDEDKQTAEDEENMDAWKRPNIELKVLSEVYPKVGASAEEGCQQGAKTV